MILWERVVFALVVGCLSLGRKRIVKITEGEEGVGNIFLVPELHLPCCGEIEGVLAPDQGDIVLVVAVERLEKVLPGIEKLQGITDARRIDHESEKGALPAPREAGHIAEGGVLACFEIPDKECLGRLGGWRPRTGRRGLSDHLDGREAAVVAEDDRPHAFEFGGRAIGEATQTDIRRRGWGLGRLGLSFLLGGLSNCDRKPSAVVGKDRTFALREPGILRGLSIRNSMEMKGVLFIHPPDVEDKPAAIAGDPAVSHVELFPAGIVGRSDRLPGRRLFPALFSLLPRGLCLRCLFLVGGRFSGGLLAGRAGCSAMSFLDWRGRSLCAGVAGGGILPGVRTERRHRREEE